MMIRRRFPTAVGFIVLLGWLATGPTVSHAQALTNRYLCIQDLDRPFLLPPIPVGCVSIDCCPGCPGREAIAWRIRLGGDAIESMVLEFEGLPAGSGARMTLEGDARWVDERRLEIKPGVTFVRGLPRDVGGRSPVALSRVGRVRSGPERIRDAAGAFDFSVEQFVGLVRVNEIQFRYRIIDCRRPPLTPLSAPDVVRLDYNASNDNGIVLLDARRDIGCVNDEVWRGTGSIPIGNALTNSTCRSEVIVFSNHSAVQLLLSSVTAWTDTAGDLLPVPLTPLLQMPVAIYVVRGPFTGTGGSGYGDAASDHVARANDLYGPMNCGLALQPVIVDATGNPNASSLLVGKCSQAASLRQQIGFAPGKLNVYYISDVLREDTSTSVRGATCGLVLTSPTPDDWNTILVSTLYADAETLAHEVGHALSLAHTNTNPDVPATNLMNGAGTGRNSLTEGQCFRVNVNPRSALNVNGPRTGPTRSCPDTVTSPECPALSLDVNPNN
jgi:hypothetical protein